MIRIRGKVGEAHESNKIYFEPRPGFTRGKYLTPSLEFPLIYGHKCPKCGNIIQALFKAPKAFSLWPYEETTILSQGEKNSGETLKTYPDDKTRTGKSCYKTDFRAPEGGSVKITLKNHIMRHQSIETRDFNGAGLWEEGEKPCTHSGIFSLREDLLVKDFLLFGQLSILDVNKYNLPSAAELVPPGDKLFTSVPAVGIAPPVILVEKQPLVYGYHHETSNRLTKYIKPKEVNKEK